MRKIFISIFLIVCIEALPQTVQVPLDFVKWSLMKDDSLQVYKKLDVKKDSLLEANQTKITYLNNKVGLLEFNNEELQVIIKRNIKINNNQTIIIENKDKQIKSLKTKNTVTLTGALVIITCILLL